MLAGCVGDFHTAEHAGDFFGATSGIQRSDAADSGFTGRFIAGFLADRPLPVGARRHLRLLAYGFARARCAGGGHGFLLAYSCKRRAVSPPCNTRRMVETAAHLADHVIPNFPVREWVLSVPKRLCYILQADPAVQNLALHIFLSALEQGLRAVCPAGGNMATLAAVPACC